MKRSNLASVLALAVLAGAVQSAFASEAGQLGGAELTA